MTKNRQADKKARKAKQRQIEKAREASSFKKKAASSLASFVSNPQTGYEFWLLHGANFLLSSYEQGVWSPMFPEVYEGKSVARTELFRRLMEKHFDNSKKQLSPAGTKTVIWTSLKPKEMFSLVFRARQFSWAQKLDPLKPRNPEVWNFLHTVMEQFVTRLDAAEKTSEGQIHIPADQYGEILPEAIAQTVADLSGVADPSRTGSLWEKSEGKGIPGLDQVEIRPPTPEEVEELRHAAAQAEADSPFRD